MATRTITTCDACGAVEGEVVAFRRVYLELPGQRKDGTDIPGHISVVGPGTNDVADLCEVCEAKIVHAIKQAVVERRRQC